MAYKSCAANIAASIIQDCNRPLVGGYTGRAVIIPTADWARAEVVADANNPRKIMSIVLPPDGSAMAYTIDNVFATPFTGSTTAGNNDSGRNGYLKTLAVRIPMRGADVSRDIIEPLVKDADGFVVIAEKRDKVGDGSYEVIGYQNSMRGDIASVTRDESANGGDWLVNLTTIEKWAEVTLVGNADNYETAKKEFEGLLYFETPIVLIKNIGGYSEFDTITSISDVVLEYVKNGQVVRTNVGKLDQDSIAIDADAGTDAKIYGYITYLQEYDLTCDRVEFFGQKYIESLGLYDSTIALIHTADAIKLKELNVNGCKGLNSLDLSKNTALTTLDCGHCTSLTSLDLSKNTALTVLYCNDTSLTSLDVSKNTALTNLYCNDMPLTSLDVSRNTALTWLNCYGCTSLMLLDIQNTSQLIEGNLFEGITNLTTLQVAGTSAWAYEKVESWLSDYAPDDGKIYVDENTPQGVITEAEAKNWEVIYQS